MDKSTFEQRINEARGDKAALNAIAEELKVSSEPWARPLQIKAVGLSLGLLAARQPNSPPLKPASPLASPDRSEWASRFQLPRPDGRPLYRYRLSTEAFELIQSHLSSRARELSTNPSPADSALFVLWAAEWFRRCYHGGIQRWDDLGAALDVSMTAWAGWRRLADAGLKQWRIPELWINGAHYRLAALARQGGFPVAALEAGGSGWAARYLERLVGLLLAEQDPSLETADRHALELSGSIPETWRNEQMRIVSAELAIEVVRLRRIAEAGGAIAGSLVSAWLDQNRPAWRDELPLVIEGESGRALVDGLMRAAALKGGSGSISATRLLLLHGDERQERVRLTLDGSLESAAGRAELAGLGSQWSRLRLYAAGTLAQYAAGELALVEPEEEGRWSARSTARSTEFALPFPVLVQAELRGEGRRVYGPFTFSGGEAISEGMRVYSAGTADEVSELALIATASGSFRAEQIFVDLPNGWSVEIHGDDSACEHLHGQSGQRSIWGVRGSALVTSAGSDTYLLRAGQSGDKRDTLSLIGDHLRQCVNSDRDVPVFRGWPRLELCDGGRPRGPSAREAWWRLKGETTWHALAPDASYGRVEIAWRDSETGHIRDKREAVVLPPAFDVNRTISGDSMILEISGWPGELSLDSGHRVSATRWRFPARGSHRSHCAATLTTSPSSHVQLHLALPHSAHLSDWTGSPVRPNAVISLSEISQFLARTEGRCELMADLLDRNRKPVPQGTASWFVDGELPLSAIRDDLEGLLRPLGEIDATVRLNFNDGNEEYWFISEFGVSLRREVRGLIADRAITQDHVQIAGRALANPTKERTDFGSYGLVSDLNHRPIQLPTLNGDWLIYLRDQDRILSRPHFIRGVPLAVHPDGALARAMACEQREERQAALEELCSSIVASPSAPETRATLRSIVELALSLHGLPPSTFDILLCLVSRPELGPLLLFEAASNEMEAVIRLADALPIDWSMLAKRHWETAARAQFEVLITAMPDALPLFAEAISARRRQIAELEPTLAPQLDLPAPAVSTMDAAQALLNLSGDRIPETAPNPFRPELESLLPGWTVSEHFYRALDAPHAAALAAQEKVELDLGHVYAIKDIARQHPRYFREAYAAALRENPFG